MNEHSRKHNHQNCYLHDYYYETLRIDVLTSDYYVFSSESNINTYAYLYRDNWTSSYPELNLISFDDDSCIENQFRMTIYLQVNMTYILLVTTSAADKNIKGKISLIIEGPDKININTFRMYIHITGLFEYCQYSLILRRFFIICSIIILFCTID